MPYFPHFLSFIGWGKGVMAGEGEREGEEEGDGREGGRER